MKKIIAPFFFPLPICVGLLSAGLVLLWFTRRQRTGKVMVTAATILLALLSYNPLPDALLAPMESRYPALTAQYPAINSASGEKGRARYVVVLGGGHIADEKISCADRLAEGTLYRLVEGVLLHRALAGSKIVLSGGEVFESGSDAKAMSEVARGLGVGEENLILEEKSRDTEEQARLVKAIVGDKPFVLVTSASHMRRAVVLFEKQGMNPIAAPTHHMVKGKDYISPGMFFPNPWALEKATIVFYEKLGLLWSRS